ncbi:MAG: UDP-N-acetylglucosamine 2-epimerase (non-hydrolyzing) [Planctomycetota bacterium]|nr:MAG: UDP-N-acetylglucosamine 2-epimerase (non-hydrolyzing) [Planctomycetota bacterium]
MPQVSLIAAARPNFMKVAPLMRALRHQRIDASLIHTGQHYDRQMSGDFFEQLGIPEPDVNLEVGSGSHIYQIAEVMRRLEEVYDRRRPDAVVVVGDVNSTLAATLAAVKLNIPVAHVEAGLRSRDRGMPEEVNRVLVDAVSQWLFVSEPAGLENLRREGVPDDRAFLVGNIMIDTLLAHIEEARQRRVFERYGVRPRQYALLTLHRPSNVDSPERLRGILQAASVVARSMPVLFPIHPRTAQRLQASGLADDSLCNGYTPLPPLGYFDAIGLIDAARLVLTDSGGVQEETTALRVPCLTLRENTERPITITEGSNRLVGCHAQDIEQAISDVLALPERLGNPPPLWDGAAAVRIARILRNVLQ